MQQWQPDPALATAPVRRRTNGQHVAGRAAEGPVGSVPDVPGSTAPAAAAPPKENWFDRPMRWAQLTLVENDPVRYDVQHWLDYFREIRADAACLSAGGCVAYYPTR